MYLYFCDENNKFTEDLKNLMLKAFEIVLRNEFNDTEINIDSLPVEASVSIVTNDEIKELNNEYRGIDNPTDVLSFPQFESKNDFIKNASEDTENLLGDVVISFEKALSQAEEYGTGITREAVYLFTHSIFHLLGYDHMTDEDKKIMRAKEEMVMEELSL